VSSLRAHVFAAIDAAHRQLYTQLHLLQGRSIAAELARYRGWAGYRILRQEQGADRLLLFSRELLHAKYKQLGPYCCNLVLCVRGAHSSQKVLPQGDC
jgi:hypothetical protein